MKRISSLMLVLGVDPCAGLPDARTGSSFGVSGVLSGVTLAQSSTFLGTCCRVLDSFNIKTEGSKKTLANTQPHQTNQKRIC